MMRLFSSSKLKPAAFRPGNAVLAGTVLCLFSGLLWAAGLSLKQPEFRVENLLPGRVYVGSRDVLQSPLTVGNKMDSTLDFSVQAYVPEADQLRNGAEPIPDAGWITFSKDYFSAGAGEEGKTDFFISVPNDKSLLGRKFQVQYVIQTVGGGGGVIRLGLGGRAFLTVFKEEVAVAPEEKDTHQYGVRFKLDPGSVQGDDVPVGKKVTFEDILGRPLQVKNDGDFPARVSLRLGQVSDSFVEAPGKYSAGPSEGLKLGTKKLTIPPHSAKEVKGFVRLPKGPDHLDKRYYWIILVENQDERAPVEKLGRIFIHTKK